MGPNELGDIAQAFDDTEKYHYSGILCAIDGCHIEKEAPYENLNAWVSV